MHIDIPMHTHTDAKKKHLQMHSLKFPIPKNAIKSYIWFLLFILLKRERGTVLVFILFVYTVCNIHNASYIIENVTLMVR